MTIPAMESTSESLLAAGKGILAADESYPTLKKRFAAIDLASTEESRRNYRDMLFTTPGLNEFISGVILFDETLQAPSLKIWKGSQNNVVAAQAALHHRAKCHGLAIEGLS